MRGKVWFILAGLFGASAVGIGAYHAHGMTSSLQEMALDESEIARRLSFVETAYRYQLVHAVALLALGGFIRRWPGFKVTKWAATTFAVGVCLFCGSLYGLAATGNELFSRMAPIGGMALIAGWVLVALVGLLMPEASDNPNQPPV